MTFDPAADGCESLEEVSRQLITGLPTDLRDSADSSWTFALVKCLDEMGQSRGLHVCGHRCSGQAEWMLDVVWMRLPGQHIVLAAESEWRGAQAIREDFAKLMVAKAARKLMVFNTSDHKGWQSIITALQDDMTNFPDHLSGEQYLLLEVTTPGAYRYNFQVPSDGRLGGVMFQSLGRHRLALAN